jgi:hypothetical protein
MAKEDGRGRRALLRLTPWRYWLPLIPFELRHAADPNRAPGVFARRGGGVLASALLRIGGRPHLADRTESVRRVATVERIGNPATRIPGVCGLDLHAHNVDRRLVEQTVDDRDPGVEQTSFLLGGQRPGDLNEEVLHWIAGPLVVALLRDRGVAFGDGALVVDEDLCTAREVGDGLAGAEVERLLGRELGLVDDPSSSTVRRVNVGCSSVMPGSLPPPEALSVPWVGQIDAALANVWYPSWYPRRGSARWLSGAPQLRGWDSNPQPFG